MKRLLLKDNILQSPNEQIRPNLYLVLLCRAEPIIIIRWGTSTSFSVLDSYVEPNLSNVILNQAKISFIFRSRIQFCLIFQIEKFDGK